MYFAKIFGTIQLLYFCRPSPRLWPRAAIAQPPPWNVLWAWSVWGTWNEASVNILRRSTNGYDIPIICIIYNDNMYIFCIFYIILISSHNERNRSYCIPRYLLCHVSFGLTCLSDECSTQNSVGESWHWMALATASTVAPLRETGWECDGMCNYAGRELWHFPPKLQSNTYVSMGTKAFMHSQCVLLASVSKTLFQMPIASFPQSMKPVRPTASRPSC